MTVTLNIQDDHELRAYCKDLVKGQIDSLTRDEMRKHISEEFDRKVKNLSEGNFNAIVKDAFKQAIKQILMDKKVFNHEYNGQQQIREIIKDIVDEYIEREGRENLVLRIAKQLTQTK